jgi:hypothetical protein
MKRGHPRWGTGVTRVLLRNASAAEDIANWPIILNQLAIRFEERFPI